MNNYIYAYYQAIKDGSVTVNKWIKAVYRYLIKGLENRSFYFDQKKANAAIKFIENFCRHHEGALAPQLIRLELWQKALISALFGIVDEKGNRQFREVFVVIARKNGKTLLASAIAEYCTFCDGEYGGRIYFCAPKLEQANLCFDAYYQTIKNEPMLDKLAKKRRSDIYIESTNTSARPLAFNAKKSDGLNVSCCIADELASWQGDQGLKFYEVIKSSFGSRRQPLMFSISTAGYINEGIYDELIKRATAFLLGNSKEKRLLPILYTIDDVQKWNDINELQKSNPNLGVSVTVDYLLEEIAIAENSLSKRSEFITKYCNIKQNSSTAWLHAEVIEKASGAELDLKQFAHCYCTGGIDLSRTTDLTSCCVVIEKDDVLHVFSKFFLPAEKIEEAKQRDGLPYDIYIKKGWLVPSGDNFIDYHDCLNWFKSLVYDYQIYPLQVGYDRYCAQYLVKEMEQESFHMDDVFQGFNLTPVIREFEGTIKDGAIDIGNNDLLKVHLLNTGLKMDAESEKCRIIKIDKNGHIDGTAALLDALTVRQKWWSEIGRQLKNKR